MLLPRQEIKVHKVTRSLTLEKTVLFMVHEIQKCTWFVPLLQFMKQSVSEEKLLRLVVAVGPQMTNPVNVNEPQAEFDSSSELLHSCSMDFVVSR